MANPAIVACAADAWTKVATNVTTGMVHVKMSRPSYSQTYRLTGEAAPTDLTDAIPLPDGSHAISATAGIDVYIWSHQYAGAVRVDV